MISNNTSLSSGNIHPKLRSVSRQLLIALLLAFGSVSAWSDETASAAPQPEAPKPPAYRELTETTEKVATAYAEHYFNREFDAMELLSDAEIAVDDPTATTIWGGASHSGRDEVYSKMRQTFDRFTHMAFRPTRRFFSGEHAIFEGELDWTFKAGPEGKEVAIVGMPLVVVVQVRAGKVILRRDYADYRVFMKQLKEQVGAKAKE